MNDTAIRLLPSGTVFRAQRGQPIRDSLFEHGVEFPCGGAGRCGRCKVRLIEGEWDATLEDVRALSTSEIEQGWRLACHGKVRGPLALEIGKWSDQILADQSTFAFEPADGLGIAIDVGSTTIVAQLLDRQTAEALATATGLNPQAAYGGDIMSRIAVAVAGSDAHLTRLVRDKAQQLIDVVISNAGRTKNEVKKIMLVGNTTMHHLFCGVSVGGLAEEPFEPTETTDRIMSGGDLGLTPKNAAVVFLPPIGGFVGSDVLAGIVATRLHETKGVAALLDLGTNGEVVVTRERKLLCASTAAGPAFEGAGISVGMRAATGAISGVNVAGGQLHCEIIGGGGEPRGICGSGLVDAVAAGLELGIIEPSGRLNGRAPWEIANGVTLQQRDIRELQLAKAATAAALLTLVNDLGAKVEAIEKIYIAGAFGNYVRAASAARIGLIPIAPEKVVPVGNAALLGAKMALFPNAAALFQEARGRTQHVRLSHREDFQELYLSQIAFPG